MDDFVGQDLTRLDLTSGWCFDYSVVTWWTSPPSVNQWAFWDGWKVDGKYVGDFWVTQPYEAEGYAEGYYHFTPTNDFYHTLANAIRYRYNGSATCYNWHWGTFPTGYDIDIECYYL